MVCLDITTCYNIIYEFYNLVQASVGCEKQVTTGSTIPFELNMIG